MFTTISMVTSRNVTIHLFFLSQEQKFFIEQTVKKLLILNTTTTKGEQNTAGRFESTLLPFATMKRKSIKSIFASWKNKSKII